MCIAFIIVFSHNSHTSVKAEEKLGGKKGRLLGIICLSDVLQYLVGEVAIGESLETEEEE